MRARCPIPTGSRHLRPLTGRDDAVARFLEAQPGVSQFIDEVARFIEARMPEHQAANRRYLTVAIGCTGGQHRSVYIAEQLAERIAAPWRRLRSGIRRCRSFPRAECTPQPLKSVNLPSVSRRSRGASVPPPRCRDARPVFR